MPFVAVARRGPGAAPIVYCHAQVLAVQFDPDRVVPAVAGVAVQGGVRGEFGQAEHGVVGFRQVTRIPARNLRVSRICAAAAGKLREQTSGGAIVTSCIASPASLAVLSMVILSRLHLG